MNRLSLLLIAIVLTIAACGSSTDDATSTSEPLVESTAETDEAADSTTEESNEAEPTSEESDPEDTDTTANSADSETTEDEDSTTSAEDDQDDTTEAPEATPAEDEISAAAAQVLCRQTYDAWQTEFGGELLGLATPAAQASIQDRFGSVGALRGSGTDCFFLEVLAETDGALGAIGDLTLGMLNGSPVVESVSWRSPADLDTDANFAARFERAPLIVGIEDESEGEGQDDPRLSASDFTDAEIDQLQIDCIYGNGITVGLDGDTDACATLLQIDLDPDNFGNSYAQTPDEFLLVECRNGDPIACAEQISREPADPRVSANGTLLTIEGYSDEQITALGVECLYFAGVSIIDGSAVSSCATLMQLGFSPADNYGLGTTYLDMSDDEIIAACNASDAFACAEGEFREILAPGQN